MLPNVISFYFKALLLFILGLSNRINQNELNLFGLVKTTEEILN